MNKNTSPSHSYDTAIAAEYGIEQAALIHFFQYKIKVARLNKEGVKEGRCWTRQTRKDIQAHFPNLTLTLIRYHCQELIKKGILITDNFNEIPVDRTLWYAFADEKKFSVDEESLKRFDSKESLGLG
jgi:hypothetical protein